MTRRGQTTRRGGCQVTIVRQPVLGGHGVRWSGWGSARWGRTARRNGRPRFGGFNVCRSLPVSYTVRQTTAPRVIKPLTERDLGATQQQRLAATTRPGSPSFFFLFLFVHRRRRRRRTGNGTGSRGPAGGSSTGTGGPARGTGSRQRRRRRRAGFQWCGRVTAPAGVDQQAAVARARTDQQRGAQAAGSGGGGQGFSGVAGDGVGRGGPGGDGSRRRRRGDGRQWDATGRFCFFCILGTTTLTG